MLVTCGLPLVFRVVSQNVERFGERGRRAATGRRAAFRPATTHRGQPFGRTKVGCFIALSLHLRPHLVIRPSAPIALVRVCPSCSRRSTASRRYETSQSHRPDESALEISTGLVLGGWQTYPSPADQAGNNLDQVGFRPDPGLDMYRLELLGRHLVAMPRTSTLQPDRSSGSIASI